jgi:hypothetical protein
MHLLAQVAKPRVGVSNPHKPPKEPKNTFIPPSGIDPALIAQVLKNLKGTHK